MNSYPQQQDAFVGYQNFGSRSPTSNRPGYATTGALPGGSRQLGQRPQQQQQQQQHVYPAIDGQFNNAYENTDRYDRMTPGLPGLHGNFTMTNQAAWAYNGNGNQNAAATVNGPMGDGGMRSSRGARRPPIPDVSFFQHPDPSPSLRSSADPTFPQQTWMQPEAPSLLPHGMLPAQPSMYASQGLGSYGGQINNGVSDHFGGMQAQDRMSMHSQQNQKNEELIPTAIVIKNIPFSVRKEVLQEIMAELNLPQPYAFNYHFDAGIFRGLAFANFQNASDTQLVIERLNQFEVQNRKLRVEYKKMLPEHERERIEREKRQKRGQLEEQHRPINSLQHQGSLQSLTSNHDVVSQQRPASTRKFSDPTSQLRTTNFPSEPSAFPSAVDNLDMNDPVTLGFWTDLAGFDANPTREILDFSPTLSPEQRRILHILAHRKGLDHKSCDGTNGRFIRVMKRTAAAAAASASAQAAATAASAQRQREMANNASLSSNSHRLYRAATFDHSESRMPPSGHNQMGRQGNPTLEVTGGNSPPEVNLRGAKSFADLRRTPSPGQDAFDRQHYFTNVSGLPGTTPTTPSGTIRDRASEASLNSVNSITSGMASLGMSNHGTIGGQRVGINGATSRNAPERQPRNPGPDSTWDTSNGFNRARANGNGIGHRQRGSGGSSTHDSYHHELLTSSETIRAGNSAGPYQH